MSTIQLTAREYAYGKILAVLVAFLGVLAVHQLFAMVLYQLVPHEKMDEFIGPFRLTAYVVPALAFGLPTILFTALTSFAVGPQSAMRSYLSDGVSLLRLLEILI